MAYAVDGLKRCSRCGETMPVEEFHRNRAMKDGLQNNCKQCNNRLSNATPRKPRPKKERAKKLPKPRKKWVSTEKSRANCRRSGHMYAELYRLVSGLPRSNVKGMSVQVLGKAIYKELCNGNR